mgnify:CR=1 FL=1
MRKNNVTICCKTLLIKSGETSSDKNKKVGTTNATAHPKSNRKKRLGFLIPYLIPPILTGLTVKAVESHLLSEETHCPKGYIKFGKNCIPKGLCPTGYVKMNF